MAQNCLSPLHSPSKEAKSPGVFQSKSDLSDVPTYTVLGRQNRLSRTALESVRTSVMPITVQDQSDHPFRSKQITACAERTGWLSRLAW